MRIITSECATATRYVASCHGVGGPESTPAKRVDWRKEGKKERKGEKREKVPARLISN